MSTKLARIDLLWPERRELTPGREPTVVLVRCGGVPVGRLEFPHGVDRASAQRADMIPDSVAEAALRASLAALLNKGIPPGPATVADALRAGSAQHVEEFRAPTITVAICTRDRVTQLERALASIIPSLGSGDDLLVIDNASRDDAVERLVRQQFPSIRLVREERPGLSWARNRAIIESRSDVISFCDDDCVMEPGTLPALRAVFARNGDVDAVTGLVEPFSLDGPSDLMFDRYFASDRRYRRRWVQAPHERSVASHVGNTGLYGTGASLAIRRRTFDQVGVFDAALGPGTRCGAGDDMEFLFRMLKCDGMLVCEPRISVQHEHRAEVSELEAQVEGWSRGFACAVERAKLAFPEERVPYSILAARIALLYHARRATQPAFRRLALAELRGIVGAKRLYVSSRNAVEETARRVQSPAGDAAPSSKSQRPSRNGCPSAEAPRIAVDLNSLGESIRVDRGAQLVSMEFRKNGRSLGTATVIPSRDGDIGRDRLHDIIIDHVGPALLARPWKDAVRETRGLLQENLLEVLRG